MTEREKELEEQLREMSVKFINVKSKAEDLIADLKQAEKIRLKLVKQLRGKNENN
jgi:HPt (histidine-containing phosphotransfer) domain-containing protein|tara:strand:- start:198 stop:362 length:165 start_codon:yes stop_codon:yes gene_type:complete